MKTFKIIFMSTRSTPKKSPRKEVKYCENVDEEFDKRVLSLFVSFYDQFEEVVASFPPVKYNGPIEQKKEIKASILDLRLRRLQEKKLKQNSIFLKAHNSKVEETTLKLRESNINLDSVFAPDQPLYPEIPRYIQYELEDYEKLKTRPHVHHAGLNLEATEKIFLHKLQQSEEKGKERARRRVALNSGKVLSKTPDKHPISTNLKRQPLTPK